MFILLSQCIAHTEKNMSPHFMSALYFLPNVTLFPLSVSLLKYIYVVTAITFTKGIENLILPGYPVFVEK